MRKVTTLMQNYAKNKSLSDARTQKLQDLTLNASEIKLGGSIGEGGFSVVHMGLFHNIQVAVKVVKRKDGSRLNKLEKEAVENELLMTWYLADPNVLSCYGFAHEPDRTLMVFAPYGQSVKSPPKE